MNIGTKELLCSIIIIIMLVNVPLFASGDKEHLQEEALALNAAIQFFGKVVDQFNVPVEGAVIKSGISGISSPWTTDYKPVLAATNEQGCFEISGEGCSLSINEIEKEGHTFFPLNAERSYKYSSFETKTPFIPNKSNPVVFKLRKKGYPDFLIYDSQPKHVRFDLDKPRDVEVRLFDETYFDSYGNYGTLPDATELAEDINPLAYKQIIIRGNPQADGSYQIEVYPTVGNSGCCVSNEFLYEAPANGYQNSVMINFGGDEAFNSDDVYVYFNFNNGLMYSLLKIHSNRTSTKMNLSITRMVNPSGSRGFELDSEYNFEESQWRQEIHKLRKKEKLVVDQSEFTGMAPAEQQVYKNKNDDFEKRIKLVKQERKSAKPRWWHNLEKE